MKSLLRITGVTLVMVLVFASCKKSVPKQVRFIPKDASFVIGINPKNLNGKLAKSNISLDSLFKSALADNADANDVQKWDDLKNSGINFQSDVYAFVQIKGSIMSGSSTTLGAVAALDDATKFEAYIKKQKPGITVQKANGFSFATIQNSLAIGWSGDIVVLAGNPNTHSMLDTTANATAGAAQQQQVLADIFALKEEASVASIAEFRDLTATKADALLWTNSSNTLNTAIPMIAMTKASDLMKDSYGAGFVNFEDGKVAGEFKYYANKAFGDILKKYAGPTVDMGMVDQYPSANIDGFGVFSFNPQLITAIVQFIGLDATANSYLNSSMGFTLDDVTKAFKGDFAIIASDAGEKEVTSPYNPALTYKQSTVKYLFNARVGDKAAYTKVTAALAAKGVLVANAGGYTISPVPGIAASIDDKNVLVASDSALLLDYKAGKGKATLAADVKDKVKGSATAMYFDIAKIMTGFTPAPADTTKTAIHQLALKTFRDAYFASDNYDGKAMKSIFEMRTVNEKENSLASIVKFSAGSARLAKIEEKKANADALITAPVDTVAAPAVPAH
ncbi:DUF4836 family protein [Deminuibacter soli]|uniref:DUF4836 family protein n=1 Tax=Deminuibacter soli TaxID=2291815 RepID=A0A3E1NFT2_9BACT|nr:DUF4836 family protein [Deminuibacter soli]RFM26732.1 DUF4836 family protein [Deminuibacter soli]